MTRRHLRIFVEVCKTLNTTSAAARLHLSQPAVSLAIKELEQYYGVRLFDRISQRLSLTGTGETLLNYASHILTLFDDMEQNIRNADALGRLRVGSSITIGALLMPDYVKAFTDVWPQVQLKVVIDSSDVIIQKVLSNELDLALIEGVSQSPYLTVDSFMSDELAVICSPRHTLSAAGIITLDELRQEKVLLREPGSGTRDLFDHVMASLGVSIEPAWESTSTTALINAAAKNLGIAVIPLRFAQTVPSKGKIALLKLADINLHRVFNIISHKNKFLTPSAKSFIDICKKMTDETTTPAAAENESF